MKVKAYIECVPESGTFQFSICCIQLKIGEDLENLNELVSSENQIKELRLQYKLGEQNLHENIKKVIEPVTDTIKDTSPDITKTLRETSNESNKAKEKFYEKGLDLINEEGIIAPYLASFLVNLFNPEKKIHLD